MKPIRLLIVDDHIIVRKGILMFLNTEPFIDIVGEAEGGQEAIERACCLQPDVILMDLVMPQGDGIQAIAELKRCLPEAKIIVLTTFKDDKRVEAAIEAGANGYLLKDADGEALLRAIRAVLKGEMPLHPSVAAHFVKRLTDSAPGNSYPLTDREKEILQLLSRGLTNKAIAKALRLSSGTIKIHISNILSKLQVTSRTEATFLALQKGLVSREEP
jgi:NarL family two-component system response regulator LiaR